VTPSINVVCNTEPKPLGTNIFLLTSPAEKPGTALAVCLQNARQRSAVTWAVYVTPLTATAIFIDHQLDQTSPAIFTLQAFFPCGFFLPLPPRVPNGLQKNKQEVKSIQHLLF